MKITNKFKDILLIGIFYGWVVLLLIGFFKPTFFQFWPSYETLFILIITYLFYTKFLIRTNVLAIIGISLLIFAAFLDYFQKDTYSLFYANVALILFIVCALSIFMKLIFSKSKKFPKKILFVANAIVGDNPGVSGGESRFIEIGKEWQRMGYEIHLFSGKGGKRLCEQMGLNVILHELTASPRDSRFEFFRRLFLLFIYMPKLIREFPSGIVYSTSEQVYDVLPGAALKLFYWGDIKFASAVHWLPPIVFWKRQGSRWFNSLFFMVSERVGLVLAYIFADAMLPVSNSTLKDMEKSYLSNNRTYEVKCGVTLSEIKEISKRYPEKKYDAVFMKRIQSVKGIFDLIDIWDYVVKENPSASLIIIGSGIDEDKAKEYVKEKKLEKNIEFLGVIYDFETKFKYLSESKLFVLPSLEENWAIVIGEAMAASIPVICYDLKELREVWKDSVNFIEFRNKKLFAKKILNLLRNNKDYDKVVNRGLEFIEQYDWKLIAQDELKFIFNKHL